MPRSKGFNLAALLLAGLMGLAAGIGAFTFVYAHGASYLTDNPAAASSGRRARSGAGVPSR